MTKRISFTVIVCTGCVALLAGSLAAQQPSSHPSAAPNTPILLPGGPPSIGLPGGPPSTAGGPARGAVVVNPYTLQYPAAPRYSTQEDTGPRARLEQELGRLMTILSNNPDEEDRAKATEAAQKAIAEYFDLDMKSRRQELDRVKQRAMDMEETLTKRAAAKEELVDLQMKSLELEANGLGLVPTVRSVSEHASSRQVPLFAGMPSQQEDPRATARGALQVACHKYQSAATENKDEAADALREALSSYFDADMQVRRAELDEIRSGLEKLEQSIEKRADSRDEIIQVELQLILNQASGLGFFGDSQWNERVVVPNYAPVRN